MPDIARADWSGFEKLVFKMLQDLFGFEENDENRITKEQKDGGYDGIFFLPSFIGGPDVSKDLYKVIFEAKLRGSTKRDLPLSAFSKSLIIAINISANMMIVATNLHFSSNTLDVLYQYSCRTGLKIKTISATELMDWIQGKGAVSSHAMLDGTQIKKLIEDAEKNTKKPPTKEAPAAGFGNAGALSDLRLIGEERIGQLEEALNALRCGTGILIITGEAGVGKSVFCQMLLQRMEREGLNSGKIDLQQCQTPRLLFINILEHLWQIPADLLFRIDSWEETIRLIGDGELQENLKEAVLYAFQQSDTEYKNQAAIFNTCLIEYLYRIQQVVRKKAVFCFSNVNYASKDLLSFFAQLCARFQFETVLIIELREPFSFPWAVSQEPSENPILALRTLQNIRYECRLEPLNREDSRKYINTLLDGATFLEEAVPDQLIDDAGGNPLVLSTYVNYVQNALDISQITAQELYHFQNRLGFGKAVIEQFIRSLCEGDPMFIGIFALLGMLNGVAITDCLDQILGKDCTKQVNYLIRCHICILQEKRLQVWHSLYLFSMRQYHYIEATYQQALAAALLERIDRLMPDRQRASMVRIDLYRMVGETSRAVGQALELIQELYNTGQYYLAYNHGTNALKLLEQERASTSMTFQRIQALMYVIQSSFYIKGDSVQKLQSRIDHTRALFNLHKYSLKTDARYYALNCRFYLIENQYYHQFGDFDEAYATMQDALQFLAENKSHIDDLELAGELWLEYGIATKEACSLAQAIKVLTDGLKEYPGSKILQFTLNTQMYEYICPTSVADSETYLQKNVELSPFLKPAEIYHNRVHLLNCRFLRQDFDRTWEDGLTLLSETSANGLRNEEGRVCNILACTALLQGDAETASTYFKRGIRIFASDNYVANLWPLLLNYGTLLAGREEWEEAAGFLSRAYALVHQKYARRIANLSYNRQEGLPRLLGGLLILWRCLSAFPKESTATGILSMRRDLETLCSAHVALSEADAILQESNYCFGDRYLIGY